MTTKNIVLSIITPTLNNGKSIGKFLDMIRKQDTSTFSIEIIIVDGGSTDDTRKIAKKYKAKIIDNPFVFADPGVSLGIKKAQGDLLMILAADNFFRDKYAMKKIVSVFNDKKITAAFPMHESIRSDSIYTKYINTFTDPFNHFVYGNAANGRTFKKVYKTTTTTDIYDVYDYASYPDRPLIAVAQGFTIRKGFTRNNNNAFDDILPVIELINKKKHVAFVHGVKLYHHTVKDTKQFMRKQAWATINALQGKKYGIAHRMVYLSPAQKRRAQLWPFYALSLVFPLLRGLYKAVIDKELLWFYHPFLCMMSASASVAASVLFLLDKKYKLQRQ